MSDTGSTTTVETEAPLKREREEVLQTRREMTISSQLGSLMPKNFEQVMELAQAMAKGGVAVRAHLRGNPGACVAVIFYALEWRMSPYGVANKSYSVNDQIAFEASLIHAVIEMRAPLEERIKCRFEGEGDDLRCFVWAKCKDEPEPLRWDTPTLGTIQPRKSPLWKSDPEQQLWYYAVRRWARRHFPEIILGVYSKDELEDMTEEERAAVAKDVTPAKTTLTDRVMATTGDREGFKPDDLADVVENGLARPEQAGQTEPKTRRKKREEVVQPEARGQSSESSNETTPPPAAAATAPEGAGKREPDWSDKPENKEAAERSMQAQGRAALGDDPSKPETPSGEAAAAAREASFVDLVTDAPAGLKNVTPVAGNPPIHQQPVQKMEPLASATPEPNRQISTGEARTEIPEGQIPPKTDVKPKAKTEPTKSSEPRTKEEYFDHLRIWMNRSTDASYILERFSSKPERDLRGKCGVIGPAFDGPEGAKEIRDAYLRTIS